MNESESKLRAALQSAYASGDAYPDQATVHRIAASIHHPSRRARVPAWAGAAAAGAAAIAAAVVVILALLFSPRASVPGTHPATTPSPAPQPSATFIHVSQSWIGVGIGAGRISLDAHNLPPNAKVTVAFHDASGATEIISTTADAQGEAQGAGPVPLSITGPSADFTICITPLEGKSTCRDLSVQVPGSSIPSHTP